MTDKREIEALQAKARRAGRTCNLFFDEEGRLTSVFYRDPRAPGLRLRGGAILSLLSFAEIERERPAWWVMA